MKKVLIVIAVVFVVLIAALITLPIIFKDDIKAAVDKELAASINADVLFDVDGFSLSVFGNFPNITATLNEFGIVNRAPFEGTILFAAQKLEVEIDLFSLFGDKPSISGIEMESPIINIIVLEDGRANYDITFPSETTDVATEEESGEFSLGIDHWLIKNGEIVYDDATLPYYLKLTGVEHGGSGDFTQDVFDLRTYTAATNVITSYDGITYLDGQSAQIGAEITISDDISRYTFKDVYGRVNDFVLGFDGWFFMGEDYYDMDITYSAQNNSFKSLLSLIPAIFTEGFEDINTEGNLSVEGAVKGKYNDTSMPAFSLAMLVEDAMFQYPDLPTAVKNIALDMKIDNPDGVIENTSVDVKKFHMDFGNNPVDAVLSIANLRDFETNAKITASLDLGELGKMFPVEGIDMRGVFSLNASAKGTYDSTLNTMPVLNVDMGLNNGYIKTSDFPIPLEDLHFTSSLNNSTGQMKDFSASIKDFSMLMDGEKFTADISFNNLVNYSWKAIVSGGLDLEKISHFLPMEGVEIAGKIKANVETSGNMASLEAGKYAELPTSGTLSLANFLYRDPSLGYDVTISEAKAALTPRSMSLDSYKGTLGNSDIQMNGTVSNYMGFVLGDNELLKGTFDFNAGLLDLNQLMPETEETTTSEESTEEAYSAIPVPKNIDFVLNSNIKKIKYMDLDLDNASGQIILRDGIARMDGLKFNALGGSFLIAGAYDTQDPLLPKYDFKLKIDAVSIKETFEKFTIVKSLAPVAANIIGNVSTDFNISGDLGQDLMPKLETITGSGLLKILDATFGNTDILGKLSNVTKLDSDDGISLKDVAMATSISNGRVNVKPFKINLGEYPGSVEGSTGIDGSIAYNIKLDVPASKLGSNVAGLSSQLGLGEVDPNSTIPLNIGMGGTYKSPTFQLVSSDAKLQAKQALTDKAKTEGKTAIKSLADSSGVTDKITNLLGTSKDTSATDSTKTDLKTETTEKAKEALQNLFKKKKKGGGE